MRKVVTAVFHISAQYTYSLPGSWMRKVVTAVFHISAQYTYSLPGSWMRGVVTKFYITAHNIPTVYLGVG